MAQLHGVAAILIAGGLWAPRPTISRHASVDLRLRMLGTEPVRKVCLIPTNQRFLALGQAGSSRMAASLLAACQD
eukprot:COSAG01_NODE_2267_length_8037_cov_2.630054_8_plen_75_part_00